MNPSDNKRSFLLLAILLLGMCGGVSAQDGKQAFSLNESVAYALDNQKNIKYTRFERYIAEKQVKGLVARGYPQITGKVDLTDNLQLPVSLLPAQFVNPQAGPDDPPVPIEFGTQWQMNAGIEASQMVFDGTFFVGLQAARAYVDVADVNLERTKTQVVTEVVKAYYNALMIAERIQLIDANLERIQTLYDETKILNENGFAEEIDVDRLKISLTNLQLERQKLERLVIMTRDVLKFQMGMPVNDEIILTETVEDFSQRPELELESLSFHPEDRIEYKLLESQIVLRDLDMRRYKVGYYPSLYAFGYYQWNNQRNNFGELFSEDGFQISAIGLNLSIPIFDGFARQASIQEARLRKEQVELQLEMFKDSYKLELRNASISLLNAYTSLETLQKNKELAKRVYDVAQIKYKEGVGSSLEVNDAESSLKETEANYLQALFDYLLAQVEYDRVKGQLVTKYTND